MKQIGALYYVNLKENYEFFEKDEKPLEKLREKGFDRELENLHPVKLKKCSHLYLFTRQYILGAPCLLLPFICCWRPKGKQWEKLQQMFEKGCEKMEHDLDINHIVRSIRSVKYTVTEAVKNNKSLKKKMILNSKGIIDLNTDAEEKSSSCDEEVPEQTPVDKQKSKFEISAIDEKQPNQTLSPIGEPTPEIDQNQEQFYFDVQHNPESLPTDRKLLSTSRS